MKKYSDIDKQKPLTNICGEQVLRIYKEDTTSRYVVYYNSLTSERHTLLLFLSDKAKAEIYDKETRSDVFVDFLTETHTTPSSYHIVLFHEKPVSEIIKALNIIIGSHQPSSLEEWSFYFMRAHLLAYQNRETIYTDCRKAAVNSVKDIIESQYLMYMHQTGIPRSDFYIGITNDVDIRLESHEKDDNLTIDKALAFLCDSNKIAVEVENLLGKRANGFDCGQPTSISAGKPDCTRYIYL